MAAYVWNPDATFRITDSVRGDIICIGRTFRRFHSRCAWGIREESPSNAATVRNLLGVMGANPPTLVTGQQLEMLARHCLCSYHQRQISQATSELRGHLAVAVQAYEQYNDVKRRYEVLRGALVRLLGLQDGGQSDEDLVLQIKCLIVLAGEFAPEAGDVRSLVILAQQFVLEAVDQSDEEMSSV
ncbi:uncharacterized protein Z519_01050 [Cladophialophora bantiana CBS 173.52]|uniref:Uncharacterized protein n=1 Tax=Cladophialophora bantiana (strain ATCC 10958 / CBS 173.52 / CDC B-1940 / NIH 8579) TaxID=1442370 RepID=A0A0D2F5J3_CLAB1|nr:uncharacterized protein Z519_01050 [Cladophialophora bantiana CBS 173.52]KIW97466.1 hypothetical protein Z519_01050 [Cladophialophora bantiana CBS 173.52]